MKIIFGPKLGPKEPELDPKLLCFCNFLKFGSLVIFEIAYHDSLQQCITSNRIKINEKSFGSKFGPKGSKLQSNPTGFDIKTF